MSNVVLVAQAHKRAWTGVILQVVP